MYKILRNQNPSYFYNLISISNCTRSLNFILPLLAMLEHLIPKLHILLLLYCSNTLEQTTYINPKFFQSLTHQIISNSLSTASLTSYISFPDSKLISAQSRMDLNRLNNPSQHRTDYIESDFSDAVVVGCVAP